MPKKNWYIVRVKSGQEEKVISKSIPFKDTRWFVIKKQKLVVRNKFRRYENLILFPGYIFIESELDQKSFSTMLQGLHFRHGLMMKELRYDFEDTSALSDEEQKMIEHLAGVNHIVEHSEGFIENNKVVITKGPLMGLESHIIYVDRHKKMAKLKIQMFNAEKEINVSLEIISKI